MQKDHIEAILDDAEAMTALGENFRAAGLLGRHECAAAALFAAVLAAAAIALYAGGAAPALRTSLAFTSLAA